MVQNDVEVGKRLNEELRDKFGTITEASKAVGAKNASYFGSYLSGRAGLGHLVIKKLEKMGIDVDYVLNGREETLGQNSSYDLLLRKVNDLEYRLSQASIELKEMATIIRTAAKKEK